ncbi:MAG TPA: amino acid adenylation domain-containing protein, partial [Polyangiaceae bacterium]|nr:amino acid adenylation domain-containing protein [Polyangiaceae bacterium]
FRAELNPEASFRELVRSVSDALARAERSPPALDAFVSGLAAASRIPVLFETRTGAPGPAPSAFDPLRERVALHVRVAADGGSAAVEYDAAEFEPVVVERIADYLMIALDGVTADPNVTLSRVPLLSVGARDGLLRSLHATFVTPPPALSVVELFKQQARETPGALAVADETGELDYAELDAAANALAVRLRNAGVTTGARVAVGVSRSRAMVVAVLAVLKARAAYLPLDPRYPLERLSYLLEDGDPAVLLLDQKSRACMPLTLRIPIVEIELAPRPTLGAPAVEGEPVDPDSVAYVLYTSGSTGRPKGVQIPHRALTNFLISMRRCPGLAASDRVLALTTLSFDIAGLELFLPLVTGASIHVAGADVVADGARLREFAERSAVTLMQATPSTYRMLIDAGWRGNATLKLLCGGEAMPRELADQLLARSGSLWNMYGPTETTIWSTVHEVKAGTGSVSIGSPIDNTAVYVLDARGELMPHGAPGELYIGGAGVARGYFKRPELDAQRFSSDPFLGGGARMYRTGDAGRLLHDGTFEYRGRLDDQVKIRGHRIELGEIESVVREHPGVAAAVVAVREPFPGDVRLFGYYVPRGPEVEPRDLRELCQRRLPPAMVPSAWVAIDSVPLTPNGKTDRKKLPMPDETAPESRTERVPARDELERELLKIWESVLGAPVRSIKESFFDLGGHSLLVARVLSRVEKSLGVSLPLAVMLESPTIEHLAERIRELRQARRPVGETSRHFSYLVPIRGHGSRPALFCVHGAGGNVLNLYDIARNLPADQPFYGIQAAGVDGLTRPKTSIEQMATDYLEEVRIIQPKGPYFLSGYCGGGIIAYEMAQRLQEQGERVALLILIDAYRPGAYVPSRVDGWKRALKREDLPALLRRARAKMDRDFSFYRQALAIQYHLMRGTVVPHELREFWLTFTFLRTVESYALKPYAGRLTVLRARETNPEFADQNPDLGWAPLALAGLAAHEVSGDHHTLTREPHVKRLTALLENCLSDALDESSAGPSGTPDGGTA